MERDPTSSNRAAPSENRRSTARRRLRRALPVIVAALLATVCSAAVVHASEGSEPSSASRAAKRDTQKAERQANKLAEQESRSAMRKARREAQSEERRKTREPIRLAQKEKAGNSVAIECSGISIAFVKFPAVAGSPNVMQEWVTIKNPPQSLGSGPVSFPAVTYSFEGAASKQTIPIAFPVGHYLVDVHAKWASNGTHGSFDIHGNLTCAPAPNYSLQKLQTIAGSGQPPTEGPLSAAVGQTVDYTIVATNTGNTPLTFATLTDPRCDPGTISGGSLVPVEPLGTVTFTCTHTLTAADGAAGSYANVASLTATPEEGEGPSKTKETNTVVVTPVLATPEEKPNEEKEEERKKKEEATGETKSPVSNPVPSGGVLGTIASTNPVGKNGVLGFASATIPALRGPQGCVRGPFLVSIRAKGVSSVVFYLDGHKLKTLTSKNARKGLLSVRIDPSKLRIGAHHVQARITMTKASASAKAVKATRSLTIVRCHSSSVTPRFTG